MSLRVAYLLEYPTLSGGERSLLALLAELDRARFEPVVLAPASGEVASALAAARVAHVPFELGFGGRRRPFDEAVEHLGARLEGLGASLLHANSLSASEYSGLAAKRIGIPSVGHVRDIQKLKASRRRRLVANDRLITVSHATREHLIEQGLPAERIVAVWNGIDPSFASEQTLEASLWPGARGDERLLLNIGQICLRKAQGLLLESCLPVLEALDLHLMIVGRRFSQKDESRRFEEELHATVRRAGLGARVHFAGSRGDVAALLAKALLLVHPAHQEPLGRVLLEAQLCGVPVVACRVGGNAEVVSDGETGLLVPPREPLALRGAVVTLVGDEACRRWMGRAARVRAKRRFDPRSSGRGVAAVYEQLLTER